MKLQGSTCSFTKTRTFAGILQGLSFIDMKTYFKEQPLKGEVFFENGFS